MISLVLRVVENAPFHPEGPFAIASFAILAFLRLEVPEMLKHQDACFVLLGKLDNADAHQMSHMLVDVPDLLPQVRIVQLILSYESSSRSVACNTPEVFLPKAGYPLPTSNEESGKSRTFNISDRTHS